MKRGVLLRGFLALGVIWGLVFVVTLWAEDRKATPEKVAAVIEGGEFADWSGRDGSEMSDEEKVSRRAKLDEVGEMLARLDLRERKEILGEKDLMGLFFKLSDEEKGYLVDELFSENAERLMAVFDRLRPEERQMMVERSMRMMTEGAGAEALEKLQKEDPELMKRIIKKGFTTYFKEASLETKMSMLPFMDTVGEIVRGFAKPELPGL